MDFHSTQKLVIAGFLLSAPLGAIMNKTNFCTMGGVSDWVNMGKTGRLWAWFSAAAIAAMIVAILQLTGALSLSNTVPFYQSASFAWPRYILGGLMFGIGMVMGGGCLNKVLVNMAGGNLKALTVAIVAAIMAYLMTKTSFYEVVFYGWISPLTVDLSRYGIENQTIPALASHFFNLHIPNSASIIGLVTGGLVFFFAMRSADFRANWKNIAGALAVGVAVGVAWYVTGGPMGAAALEEAEWMEQRPAGLGAQSLTFANPLGEYVHYLSSPGSTQLITFGMACAAGIFLGSLLYALISRTFRMQGFLSVKEAVQHIVAGMLMGVGGVLALGCSVGQGITGVSTLACGSLLALVAMIFGSALTLKITFYKMMYEDASFMASFISSLADMNLLPQQIRMLERP